MMKQYRLEKGADGLDPVLSEAEVPEPGRGEVLIRVAACSLNYRDLLMRAGQSASTSGDGGVVPLSDGAGVVDSVGEGVVGVAVGDRVAGCFFPGWEDGRFSMDYHKNALGGSADGMLSEYVVLPAAGTVPVPRHLSLEEAACLPCAALTAWSALFERSDLQAGESVLVLGTGGVSIFALQLAVAAGGDVIVTSSSDEKLTRALDLGARHGVNYRTTPEWDREVWRITGKIGVDHVIEVGGPGTLGRSMAAVAAGGHIALIGVLTGRGAPGESLFPLVARAVRLDGIYVGHRAAFLRMNAFLEEHQIKPVIDRTFAFDEAVQAYAHVAAGAHFGKVVVAVNPA